MAFISCGLQDALDGACHDALYWLPCEQAAAQGRLCDFLQRHEISQVTSSTAKLCEMCCKPMCSALESPKGCWGVASPQSESSGSAMASRQRASIAVTPESAYAGDVRQVSFKYDNGRLPAAPSTDKAV